MNNDFKWTVDLLAEFIRDYGDKEGTAAELMDQFKESKQPKPLFTTEDGIIVHKNYSGKISVVYNDLTVNYDWPVDDAYLQYNPYTDAKYFSTKEAAEEYLINNKPCLSLTEVIDCYIKSPCDDGFKHKILSLILSKLQDKC